MYKARNNVHMLKQWAQPLGLSILTIFTLAYEVSTGTIIGYLAAGAVVALAMVPILRHRATAHNADARIRQLLQSESVHPLMKYYGAGFGQNRSPTRNAYLAFSNALACALFGEFDLGEDEINKIKWDELEPIVLAHRSLFFCLRAYMKLGDYERGLAYAQEARMLADVWTIFPGARGTLNLIDTTIEIGQALGGLEGTADARALARLEERFPGSFLRLQLIVAWALGTCYQRSGRTAEARKMRESIHRLAPHCLGLSLASDQVRK